jgi:hypothetical protein
MVAFQHDLQRRPVSLVERQLLEPVGQFRLLCCGSREVRKVVLQYQQTNQVEEPSWQLACTEPHVSDDEILARSGYILQRRMNHKKFQPWLDNNEAISSFVCTRFANGGQEKFSMVSLDSRFRLIDATTLFHGTVTQTAVYPRVVVQRAMLSNASNVVLVHNHPADGPISDADVALTVQLERALRMVDIRVLDHLVVTTFNFVSMREQGLFTPIA